jgi:hypothetical protein
VVYKGLSKVVMRTMNALILHTLNQNVIEACSFSRKHRGRARGLRSTGGCDYSHIANHEHDHDAFSKRSTLLSRSDSAYGESMRSSSSSPPLTTPCTPRLDNSYVHEEEEQGKDICCSGESYSPKSDGVNEISSGIASRSSSMTSLDSSGENKHHDSSTTTTHGSRSKQQQQ